MFHYIHHKDTSVGLSNEVELKEKVIRWIQHAPEEEWVGFGEVLLRKQMILQDYLNSFRKKEGVVDEITLYVLSRMLQEPTAVITKMRFWSTVEGDYIGDTSIIFACGGEGHYIPLQRAEDKTPGNRCANRITICTNICFQVFRYKLDIIIFIFTFVFVFVLVIIFWISDLKKKTKTLNCRINCHVNKCINSCIN